MANITQEESGASEIVKVVYYSNSRKRLNISGIGSKQIAKDIEFLDNFYTNLGEPNYVLAGLYVPLIAIATVANILVVLVVCKNQHMRSAINYLVINLCVADLLVTAICMPTAISQAISMITSHSEIMCKMVSYSQGIAVVASVFTLMVMSIDRYMAIKNPIAFRTSFNGKRMCGIIAAIWIFSLSIFGPMLQAAKLTRLGKEKYNLRAPGSKVRYVYHAPVLNVCHENLTSFGPHGNYLGVGWFALVYVIPVFIILVVHVMMARTLYAKKPPFDPDVIEGSVSLQQGCRIFRERKRIAHVLLTLAVLFALCWFPYNVLRVLLDLGVITLRQLKGDVLSYCLVFGHGNSMLNPVVYCCMTETFRRSISELLRQAWRGITNCRSLRNCKQRSNLHNIESSNPVVGRTLSWNCSALTTSSPKRSRDIIMQRLKKQKAPVLLEMLPVFRPSDVPIETPRFISSRSSDQIALQHDQHRFFDGSALQRRSSC